MKSHRKVLGILIAFAAIPLVACSGTGGGAPSTDGAPTPVNFVLNFTPGPQHEEFVVAADSFYSDAGLDVKMTSPSSTTDSISLVAGGSADVGLGYAGDVISAQAQGVPVKTVAVIHRRIALGLLSKPGSGIETPQDLIGKTVGLTMIPANVAMFDELLAANDIDPSQVNVVPVGFNGPQMVASGEVDAADAVAWYELGVYKQLTGEDATYMEFTDFDVPDGYYLSVISSDKFINEHPDTLKAFLQATLDAEKWTIENPDEADDILLANVDGVTKEFARQSRGVLDTVIVDDASQEHGLGWSDEAVWQKQVDFYERTKQIDTDVDVANLFTNDFLPADPVTVDVPTPSSTPAS
jgi:putative hydroxymethylpyrimidine transport system substrate-binding protein